MRSITGLAACLFLGACATTNEFAAAARSNSIPDLVDCVADAIRDEGFQVTERNDDVGLLNATYTGTRDLDEDSWLRTEINPDRAGYFVIKVETSDDEIAHEAATEIVTECGTGM